MGQALFALLVGVAFLLFGYAASGMKEKIHVLECKAHVASTTPIGEPWPCDASEREKKKK